MGLASAGWAKNQDLDVSTLHMPMLHCIVKHLLWSCWGGKNNEHYNIATSYYSLLPVRLVCNVSTRQWNKQNYVKVASWTSSDCRTINCIIKCTTSLLLHIKPLCNLTLVGWLYRWLSQWCIMIVEWTTIYQLSSCRQGRATMTLWWYFKCQSYITLGLLANHYRFMSSSGIHISMKIQWTRVFHERWNFTIILNTGDYHDLLLYNCDIHTMCFNICLVWPLST